MKKEIVKYYCDRCGKEISEDTVMTEIYASDFRIGEDGNTGAGEDNSQLNNYQLCSDCVLQLGIFLSKKTDDTEPDRKEKPDKANEPASETSENQSQAKVKYSEETMHEIHRLREEGWKLKSIVERLNVSQSTITNWLQKEESAENDIPDSEPKTISDDELDKVVKDILAAGD